MLLKKKILFKIITSSLLAITTGTLTSLSIQCINTTNSHLVNSLNAANVNATTVADTTWSDQSLVTTNDYLSNTDTPNGYLKVDNTSKTITMISWFGTKDWEYNLSTSPFVTSLTGYSSSSPINAHVLYLADYDRILVYGTVGVYTILFQLKTDGTEYYVNDSDTNKIANSCIVFNQTGYYVNLLNPTTGIIYRSEFDTTNLTLSATKFSLVNFSKIDITYDASGWKTDTSDSNSLYTLFTLGNMIGVYESSDSNTTYLFFKAYSTNTGTTTRNIYVMWIKLVNNVYSSINKDLTSQYVSATTPDLEHAHFKVLPSFDGNTTKVYFSLIQNISDANSIALGPDAVSGTSWTKINCVYAMDLNTGSLVKYYAKYVSTNLPVILNLYINPYNDRVYVIVKSASNNSFYFSDLLGNVGTTDEIMMHLINYVNFPTVDASNLSSATNRMDLVWRPIFEKDVTTAPTKINGIASVLSYSNATTSTPSSTASQKFTISNFTGTQVVTYSDLHATVISSYNDLVSKYYYLLPQDITTTILEEFIKIINVSDIASATPTPAYESNITLPTGGLTIDENAGTLSGQITLNVKEWWPTTTTAAVYYQIPINISVTGLATNESLSFVIVSSSDVDSTKYELINQLKTQKYPSQVTAQEILDDFLIYGSAIKLTVDDVLITTSASSGSSDKYITVIPNDNDGTLQINWNLSSVLSPSVTVRSGSYTFNNFKFLDSWQQVSLNTQAWTLLKSSKAPFQVSLSDIISCLNLSSSYSTDPTKWTWTPTYSATSNKTNWIQQNLDGSLTGTITYNKAVGEVPSNIPDSYLTLAIDATEGAGFLKITDLMGSDANSSIYYNQDIASKTASSYNLSEVNQNFKSILNNAITFFNDWTTIDSLNYQVISSDNNTINFTLSYSNSIQTNFVSADGTSLVLDSDWVQQIQASSNNLLPTMNYSFSYDLTKIDYNYNISQSNQTISIKTVLSSTTSINSSYMNMTPTKFANSFYDSVNNNYDKFLDTFNLVELPTDTTALNYYTISNVQLISDDNTGTVIVLYTFSFPNAGNNLEGSSLTSSVTLNGFPTVNTIANQWLIICTATSSAIIVIILFICLGILIYKKKKTSYLKLHDKYFSEKNINLDSNNRKYLEIFRSKPTRVRNTINENVRNTKESTNYRVKKHEKELKKLKKKSNSTK